MPKAKYDRIYHDLKQRLESGEFAFQQMLPSENLLVRKYGCSRNTVRRAISALVSDGYVQTLRGKGVRSLFQPPVQAAFHIGRIESFQESAARNHREGKTRVVCFATLTADEKIQRRTGFPVGSSLYYLQRVHYLDGAPLILNHNYFLQDVVKGLTPEIASGSIYDYLEHTLHITIVNSKRTITVEKITQIDEKYLGLTDYNCLAVVSSQTFDDNGVMFEFTQSRHRPDQFRFQENAVRRGEMP